MNVIVEEEGEAHSINGKKEQEYKYTYRNNSDEVRVDREGANIRFLDESRG